jgi:hypothetical protein
VGRPHVELGTHGQVRIYRLPSGYRATCLFRDWDGVTRQIERQAKTKGAAERAPALALRDRGRSGKGHEVTTETKIADLAEKWFSQLERKSPSTRSKPCERGSARTQRLGTATCRTSWPSWSQRCFASRVRALSSVSRSPRRGSGCSSSRAGVSTCCGGARRRVGLSFLLSCTTESEASRPEQHPARPPRGVPRDGDAGHDVPRLPQDGRHPAR